MDNRQEAARLVDETKITRVFALTFVGYELFQNLKTHIHPFLLVCHLLKVSDMHSLPFFVQKMVDRGVLYRYSYVFVKFGENIPVF